MSVAVGAFTPKGRPAPESHKTPVLGIVQRAGRVVALSVPSVKGPTLLDNFMERVLPGSVIFTDEFRQYDAIGHMKGFVHYRIRHSARVYVNGDVHTNTIEGFWSLVKRGLSGVTIPCLASISRAISTNMSGATTSALKRATDSNYFCFGPRFSFSGVVTF